MISARVLATVNAMKFEACASTMKDLFGGSVMMHGLQHWHLR